LGRHSSPRLQPNRRNGQPAHARGVWHGAVPTPSPRARWHDDTPAEGAAVAGVGVDLHEGMEATRDGAGQDKAGGSSPWCSVVSEVEESFEEAVTLQCPAVSSDASYGWRRRWR
jgi:hypothetical protein